MLKVTEIRMDYQKKPVGVAGMPLFSWKIESDRKAVLQKEYQLQIAVDPEFTEVIYDSGWTISQESVGVKVQKVTLISCHPYFVRVRVRDGEEESVFCEAGTFITGILQEEEWQAAFISAETVHDREQSKGTYLRREIEVKGEIAGAYVCTTGLGLYQFYINGKKIGQDELTPGWTSYQKHLCYQTYEVTNSLCPGKNILGALVGAGWYKGKMGFLHLRNNYGEQTAFLMQLVIRYRDGRQEYFVTDENWTGHDAPVLFSEIYDGELYDARMESKVWKIDTGESKRTKADNCENENAKKKEEIWNPVEIVSFPKNVLTPQAAAKVKVMETLAVQQIITTPHGETVLDFGQNLTGWVQFIVHGERGSRARLKCFETLDAQGNVYTANLRTALQEITYICAGEQVETYHPHFTFQGFRYAQIMEWPCEIRQEDFTACVLYSEMEQTGTFSCSHPLVNQLQQNILRSLKGNFLDIPTDCPQRDERMGWTGDAQIFCRTACFLMNTDTFFQKWLKDVAYDQTPEGGVPHVVPDIVSGKESGDWLLSQGTHSAAAWADVAVINPWTLYLMYRDRSVLEQQYDSMKKWIGFMREHAKDYIWNYRLQFGDWVALDAKEGSYLGATPNDLTCTAYFAYSTRLFSKIAHILGHEADAEEAEALYENIVDKFRRTFFTADGSMTAMTQTAHILALYFDLVPEQYRGKTTQNLVKLLEQEKGHLVTGFVGTPYFCHALSRNGQINEAYQLLLKEDFPSWLYQIKMGATTIWEHWDGLKPDGTMWSPDMNSFNHYAYGAVGEWLYRVVLGLEADEADPGYHHSIFCPQPGNAFDFAEGTYESVYGRISVRWERNRTDKQEEILLQITVPCNTTATLCLEEGAQVLEGDTPQIKEKDGRILIDCGSGTWKVRYARNTSACPSLVHQNAKATLP